LAIWILNKTTVALLRMRGQRRQKANHKNQAGVANVGHAVTKQSWRDWAHRGLGCWHRLFHLKEVKCEFAFYGFLYAISNNTKKEQFHHVSVGGCCVFVAVTVDVHCFKIDAGQRPGAKAIDL
jgi:hypothetical protein